MLIFSETAIHAQNCNFTLLPPRKMDVVCKGETNGEASIIVNGFGSSNFSAFIEPNMPSGNMDPFNVGSATVFVDTFSNLAAGTYSIVVRDNDANCFDTTKVTIEEPVEAFDVVFDSIRNADCGNNGYLNVKVSGGYSKPTIFTWDAVDANGFQQPNYPRTLNFQNTPIPEGTYTVFATDAGGCKDSAITTITGGTVLMVDVDLIGGSLPLELGDSVQLGASTNAPPGANITYSWFPLTDLNPITPNQDQVSVGPCQNTTYILVAIDQDRQCSDDVSIDVELQGLFNPWMPNAFNPDAPDPRDSEFKVFGIGIESVEMQIFDRKGALVYETPDSVSIGSWNGEIAGSGTIAAPGKYIHITKIRSVCGDLITESGGVSLIR